MQRQFAREHDVVMDGRDIGTVVLPRADVKIFLTASPEERARRRFEELQAKGDKSSYAQVLDEMKSGTSRTRSAILRRSAPHATP